jgi:Ser/Thr protein kinase RdoA (MazF antagonist)
MGPMRIPSGLFLPNNHSQWQIRYRPLEEGRAARIREIVFAQYGEHIDVVTSVEQVDEAEVNSNNFKIVGTKDGKEVIYLLRSVPAEREPDALEARVAIMAELERQGVPVPHLVAINAPVVEDGRRFLLFNFIDANHYRGSKEELMSVGRAVAMLDTQLLALTPVHQNDPGMHFTQEYLEACAFSTAIWQDVFAKVKEFTEPETQETAKQLLEQSAQILNYTLWLESQPKPEASQQVAHFDLHPHNFLTDGMNVVAILDFDSLRYTEKMRAFAFAQHRAVRQHLIFEGSDVTTERIDEAKAAFRAAYREQGTVSDEEITTGPYFMRHEAMMRLAFTMKKFAQTGELLWKQDLPKQLSVMAEAGYFG